MDLIIKPLNTAAQKKSIKQTKSTGFVQFNSYLALEFRFKYLISVCLIHFTTIFICKKCMLIYEQKSLQKRSMQLNSVYIFLRFLSSFRHFRVQSKLMASHRINFHRMDDKQACTQRDNLKY